MSIKELGRIILNLFFPPTCGFCGEIIESSWGICKPCMDRIPLIPGRACRLCGKKLEAEESVCRECKRGKRYFTQVVSACEYDGVIRDKMIDYKFNGKKYLFWAFSDIIMWRLKSLPDPLIFDMILSVPMYRHKERMRGYNQSDLIARNLSKRLGIPYIPDAVVKVKDTKPQSELNQKERRENVKGVFRVLKNELLTGKRVLLIDDVLTTGTTVNECSRVLAQAGAREIYVAVAATGKS